MLVLYSQALPGLLQLFPEDSIDVAPFGKVFLYDQTRTPSNVIIMISGDAGWKYGVPEFAESFSDMNTLVIGVDILRYFNMLRHRPDSCYDIAADFVQLSTEVEKRYNFPDFVPPVLMGYSSGATLVYGILAQARPGTFMGGISLGFSPDVELPKMFCEFNGLREKVDVPGKIFFLQADARLGNPWIVLHGKLDKVCDYKTVLDFTNKTTDAELITLPNVGHGFSKWSDFMPQWKDAYKRILAKYEKNIPENISIDKVKNLPLVLTKSKIDTPDSPVALLISGDGGWYAFEQLIADHLAKQGIPTVGLDSKRYFWKRKTPEETESDVSSALNYYSNEWGKKRLLLIGYSLGAEIVPFIVNRMPEEMKSRIESVVLLSPETTTDFEVHFSNMLGMGNRQNTYDVLDEILKMQSIPTLIIFGDGEKTKIPEMLAGTSIKVKIIPGDHHYKFNLPLIIETMKAAKAF